jgi:ABC-type nitrate/sulfonate/bicarbonate transport system permease component
MESNNMQQIMVGIVTIGIVGLLLTSVLRRIETGCAPGTRRRINRDDSRGGA